MEEAPQVPQLSPSLLATIAGAPQMDHLSFSRVKPCPFTGFWKVAARIEIKHDDGLKVGSIVVASPFIVADVVLAAVRAEWRRWSPAARGPEGQHLGEPAWPVVRILHMAGLSWLPAELRERRQLVKRNPELRRVLGTAGTTYATAADGASIQPTDEPPK